MVSSGSIISFNFWDSLPLLDKDRIRQETERDEYDIQSWNQTSNGCKQVAMWPVL